MHNKQWELQINLSYDNTSIRVISVKQTLFRVQQQFNDLVSQWNIQLIDHTGAESDAVRFQLNRCYNDLLYSLFLPSQLSLPPERGRKPR